ncbi:MAG: hypothetical protein KDB26_10900, partial [Microthrixaceae bacterium]|nr:hypothetical protein [Microthrixaceae bacterium]
DDFGGTRGESVFDRAKDTIGDMWDKVTGILPDSLPGDDLDPLGKLTDIVSSPLGTSPSTDTPISPLGDTPSTATPTSPLGNVQTPSMSSPLGNVQTPSMPSMSSPLGTSPMSSTPTTPTSSMTPQSFDQLMGNEPTAQPELFEGTEVPSDDDASTDPLGEDTDTSDKSDHAVTDPETVDKSVDDTKDDTSDGEVVTDDAAAPVTDGDAPAEPTDEQKRTVELPDGRQVTFPTEQHAALVREMLASNPENPVSLYAAADKAGFTLPPMGQDIGTPVPPMDVSPGDIVKGADGTGVSIGNGEVLMESGEIKPVEDVAKVGEAGHGIFRLETADASAPAPGAAPVVPPPAPAAEQPPAPVTEQVQPPAPVVGEPAPDAPEVSGDPLDLLAAV